MEMMYAIMCHHSEIVRIGIISVCSTEGLWIVQKEGDVKKDKPVVPVH